MRLDRENPPEAVEFMGVTYRRMGGKRKYYLSQNKAKKGAKGLHVAIWEWHNNSDVPLGYEVHHKDSDTFNCEPSNLECLPAAIHKRIPKNVSIEAQREHLDKYRHLAAAWHRSEDGIAWHREHAKRSFRKPGVDNHPVIGTGNCVWCGAEFVARSRKRKFCSPSCQVQESGMRRGKYKFVHPHFASQRLGISAG